MAKVICESRRRVRDASKAILRYIVENDLGVGDRLPEQQQLRVELGFSNDTISPAMSMFSRLGFLKRKRGTGTVIVDPTAVPMDLWNVAMPVFNSRVFLEVPFFAQLVQFLQVHLRETGYRCMVYPSGRDNAESHGLQDFPGMQATAAHDGIDALLSPILLHPEVLDWADERGLPVCHVGPWEGSANGVIIDQEQMVIDAAKALYEAGARHLGLVGNGPLHDAQMPMRGFQTVMPALPGATAVSPLSGGQGVSGGEVVAEKLLAMPLDSRPDGLVIVDDRVAMGLCAVLRRAGDYRPKLAVQVNRQAPLAFGLPIMAFEVDIEQLAHAAVELIGEQLLNPARKGEVRLLPPRFSGLYASSTPTQAPQDAQPAAVSEAF